MRGKRDLPPWWAEEGWSVAWAEHREDLRWACDECLNAGRALRARPWLQTFLDRPPHLAFYDERRSCRRCGGSFSFTKEEQQFWYERLDFWVQSRPVHCPACRRQRWRQGAAGRRLQQLLESVDLEDPADLAELSAAYLAAGRPSKAAEVLRRARNRETDPESLRALVARLEELDGGEGGD